jgi:1-acyl-sn-glycerol-3-phosphate acyltransferase
MTVEPAAAPLLPAREAPTPPRALARAARRGDDIVPAELPAATAPGTGWWGKARAASRLLVFLAWTLPLIPVQMLALRFWPRLALALPTFYHRRLCRILGVTVEVRGAEPAAAPVLIVSNHVSWLDIVVLSAVRPLSFVAKAEVARWPFFGTLARLQRTVFVERERRTRAAEHKDELASRLAGGDALVLFAEGTSSDGNRVKPFKTALFAAAETVVPHADGTERPVVVQPWTIAYTGLNGMPMGQDLRPFFAWYGDMELAPHLWQALQFGPITARIELHPPVTLADFANRKSLAAHCHADVAHGLARALAGRGEAPSRVLGRPFP